MRTKQNEEGRIYVEKEVQTGNEGAPSQSEQAVHTLHYFFEQNNEKEWKSRSEEGFLDRLQAGSRISQLSQQSEGVEVSSEANIITAYWERIRALSRYLNGPHVS